MCDEIVVPGFAIESAAPAETTSGGCGAAIDPSLQRVIESGDVGAMRVALAREAKERRRQECLANIQTEITKYSLELLVREPNLEGFFRALLKMLAEEAESEVAGVWLLNEDNQCCDFWMAHFGGQVVTPNNLTEFAAAGKAAALAHHLFEYKQGWVSTIEYRPDDPRVPEAVRAFNAAHGSVLSTAAAPMLLAGKTLGWITICVPGSAEGSWWRIALVEAIAMHAALALHKSRIYEQKRAEERRKAILEERNRLARDIHDNLAQGFGAILMQLQAAQREGSPLPPTVTHSINVAIELARTHMVEARRSVGALRPNVSNGEDIAKAIKRVAELAQKTSDIPIDVVCDELPRFGDGVEREVIGIAQEALTNAVRHARAKRIIVRASLSTSLGLRLSVADDGRGIPRERSNGGFGMTSMQERADRIGASLTIVTAPRSGTEVVLAWEPSQLPTQVHAYN